MITATEARKITALSEATVEKYIALINGQTVGGENLKPGQLIHFRIATKGNNVYRFNIYTDKNFQERYSIEPMDYPDQVSKTILTSGKYIYLINIKEKEDVLDILLKKL